MKKSKWIPLLLTLIIWAGMYYYYLPALNIHSNESWMFFVAMIVVALVINFWTIAKTLFFQRESQWESNPLLKKTALYPVSAGGHLWGRGASVFSHSAGIRIQLFADSAER